MYLISLYFDEHTDKRIRRLTGQVADATGNRFMLDGNVPPHMTISAFETRNEEEVLRRLEAKIPEFTSGVLLWGSVGQFLPYVLFLSPVLNEYLHSMSVGVYNTIKEVEDIFVSRCYQPFQWMPHVTIGKKLSRDEMETGFRVIQNQFGIFEGQVVRIGLSKTNPYREIACWDLN